MLGVALVTGSTRGLGHVIAERLADDGWTVATNGPPGEDSAFPADFTSESDVLGLVAAIESRLGPIEVLVVNATGPQPDIALLDTDWSDHLDQLDFFVKSPVLLGRAVVPGMKARGSGRIIHIDSEMADRPAPNRSAYSAAKAAQVGLARSWARELAPFGITVNTVAPGFIPVERHADVEQSVKDAYIANVPTPRWGTPADIANAVAFFAAPESSFITGQRLVVDGGRHLLP
jgi:3-oxoacyl-[acyl-carrier protein] reductase